MKLYFSLTLLILGLSPLHSDTVIDVIVAYDQVHRDEYGDAGMFTEAQNLLNFAEGVFAQDSMDVEFHIVHIFFEQDYDYKEDEMFPWFLHSAAGGIHHDFREAFGADLMVFLARHNSWSYHGQATLPGAYFAADAWWYRSGQPGYIVTHEIGHTFGAGHDLGYGDGLDEYSHAYKWAHNGNDYWTTVAHGPHGNTDRIPYFSNPDELYDGHPRGAPAFVPPNMDPNPNGAHNVLTISDFLPSAANRESQSDYLWRDSVVQENARHYLSWFGQFDLSEWHELHLSGGVYGRHLNHNFLGWCWIDASTTSTSSIWMWSYDFDEWIYTDDSKYRTAWVNDGSTGWITW